MSESQAKPPARGSKDQPVQPVEARVLMISAAEKARLEEIAGYAALVFTQETNLVQALNSIDTCSEEERSAWLQEMEDHSRRRLEERAKCMAVLGQFRTRDRMVWAVQALKRGEMLPPRAISSLMVMIWEVQLPES